MATLKNGNTGPMVGRTGKFVSYELNGRMVVRTIGRQKDKPTIGQLRARQAMKITSKFLKEINPFISVGFELEAKNTKMYAQNKAVSYNRKYAVTGEYPNQHLDFSKVLVSKGNLSQPLNPKVRIINEGLEFTWDEDTVSRDLYYADQVMLLAYFPDKTMFFSNGGQERKVGIARLNLIRQKGMTEAETYISFITHDRKSISNSVYVGKVTWPDK